MEIIKNKILEVDGCFYDIIKDRIKFENCTFNFTRNSIKIIESNVLFQKCRFFIKIELSNSICVFKECRFCNIEGGSIDIQNGSSCELSECSLNENGSYELLDSQIFLSDSILNMETSFIKGNIRSNGVEAINSEIKMNNVIISENEGCGLSVYGCKFNIRSLRIEKCGHEKEDFTQVFIDSSKGIFNNSKICKGVNSGGIFITNKSHLFLKDSVICEHVKNGLSIERYSVFDMDGCDIYKNGDEYEETLQIWLDNSKLNAKNCSVKNGICGVYAQKGGYVHLKECIISDNMGGVCIFENSELIMSDSVVVNNGFKPQLWLEDSKAKICDSSIGVQDCCESIHLEDMQFAAISNTNLQKSNISIKNCRNVKIK